MLDLVRTVHSFAALTVLLLFFCFLFSLFLADGALRWVLTIMSLFFSLGFAVFAILNTKKDGKV